MAGPTIEKLLCEECGVEARENTQYCYNCGAHVPGSVESEEPEGNDAHVSDSQAALDDLAAKLDAQGDDDKIKFAKAAEQRKLARVSQRQPREFVWEASDDSVGLRLLAVALLVAAAAVVIVYLTLYWR